jgi:23S rRNA pseudouridine2605 synthase
MRLSQYLAHAGVASRRHAEELITDGKVKVNGITITELGSKIDPQIDRVEYNDQLIEGEFKIYLLLNKPSGYLCSVSDPYGRPTVIDLVSKVDKRLYPVGRLDFDSEGLLLMTNDGYFNNQMIHPRYKINKEYQVWVKGRVEPSEQNLLRRGVELDDGITAPAEVEILETDSDRSLLRIVIHEGRKRQVKRMCSAVGHPVISLKRTAFGCLSLQGVPSGKYRPLTPGEIKQLLEMAAGR